MRNKIVLLIFLLTFSMVIVNIILNIHFSNRLEREINLKSSTKKSLNKWTNITNLINKNIKKLKPIYLNRNPRYFLIKNNFINSFIPKNYENVEDVWQAANEWTDSNEVYPEFDMRVANLLYALNNELIVAAKNSPKGTQLKLVLNLTGNQPVIFKPKWYSIKHIIKGPVYQGKDRHTAEIFGFYLGAILNFRSTPIVAGRRINLKHIYDIANNELKETMTVSKNKTQYCLYGKCYYCNPSERVCGSKDHIIEGVMLHMVPGKFSKHRSPWQRTYKESIKADWEENETYCESLKRIMPETRLLDLIDAAIFDFLIQNGDRHHYETRNEKILLIDNGKSFGNPYVDFYDILAPVYQCCIIRKSTWMRLLLFSGGSLTELIEILSRNDQLYPILTQEHYDAVERRLLYVFSTIEYCLENFGKNIFR